MGTLDDFAAEGAVSYDVVSSIRDGYGGLLDDLDAKYSAGEAMSFGDLLVYQYLLNEWPNAQSDAPPKPSTGSPLPPMIRSIPPRRRKSASGGGRGRGGGGGGDATRRHESGWDHSSENEHHSSGGGAGFGPSGSDAAKSCRHCKTPGSCADFGCQYAELLASVEARKKIRDQHIAERARRAAAERAGIAAAAAHARNTGWGR